MGAVMKNIIVSVVLALFATTALAQGTPKAPTVGKKKLVQVKPSAPMGCKLVGTVKGTKLWAGDCMGNEMRGSSEATGSVPAAEEKK